MAVTEGIRPAPATPTNTGDGNGETLLSVQNLKTFFPVQGGIFRRTVGYVQAVDDISFDIKKGTTPRNRGHAALRGGACAGRVRLTGKGMTRPSPRRRPRGGRGTAIGSVGGTR